MNEARAPRAEAGRAIATRPRFDVLMALAALVALACVLLSVTTVIDDPDVWQHLAVGRAIVERGEVPQTHLWTWVGYGRPDVLPSWLFRVLLWGSFSAGELPGLYAWRWLTAALAFGLLWAAARRMGATGYAPLWVMVLAALSYRARSQLRPETLVAVLIGLQLLLHESWRAHPRSGGRVDWRLAGIALVAWAWANAHISYWLGIAIQGAYLIDAFAAPRLRRAAAAARPDPRALLATLGASIALSFVNPFGFRALAQPFEYFLVWRLEPVYRTIVELHPIMWHAHWKSGLPLVVVGWPLLAIARAHRRGWDVAEVLLLLGGTALALSSQRFAGLYVLIAAPFVARGLAGAGRAHRAFAGRGVRAGLVGLACVATGVLEWTRPERPLGVGVDWGQYPVRACDFLAERGVTGRGFTPYYFAGYQIWRFWPERGRLPFMDIHQSGTREDRALYAYAFANSASWLELDARHRFDYAILDGHAQSVRGDRLLDLLDSDTTWALVFRDDAAALYLRRHASFDSVIARDGLRFVPGGDEAIPLMLRSVQGDSVARAAARAEIEAQVAASAFNARSYSLLATLDWIEGRGADARRHLEAALASDPRAAGVHLRLGLIALSEGRAADAVRELEAERRLGHGLEGVEFLLGQAHARSGDREHARRAYQRAIRLNPGHQAARDSLAALER